MDVPAAGSADLPSSTTASALPVPSIEKPSTSASSGQKTTDRSCPPTVTLPSGSSDVDGPLDSISSKSALTDMVDAMLQRTLADMNLSQKLVKALCMAHLGLHHSVEHELQNQEADQDPDSSEEDEDDRDDYNPSPESAPLSYRNTSLRRKSQAGDAAVSQRQRHTLESQNVFLSGLRTTDYSVLIETLASALQDVTTLSSSEDRYVDIDDEETDDDEDLKSSCANVLQEPQDIPLPPSPILKSKSRPTAQSIDKAVFTNLKSLVDLIKIDQRSSDEDSNADDDSDAGSEKSVPPTSSSTSQGPPASTAGPPCQITKLPTETLTRIFTLARRQLDASACECGSSGCAAGKIYNQKHALQLRLLCKALLPATTAAAFSVVRIRSRPQIASLMSTLSNTKSECSQHIASCIKHIELKVPALSLPFMSSSSGSAPSYLGSRSSRHRSSAFPWLQTPDAPGNSTSESSTADREDPQHASPSPSEQPIEPLIRLTPALSVFDLSISRSNSFSYSAWSILSDFLEAGLQPALSAAPALKTLIFKQCVDFGEIEQILLDCPTITDLRLEGGLDNLDARDEVADESHQCRLNSLYLNNWESVELGERQLCWLLRPSVGSLTSLELATSVSLNAGGMGGGNAFPPFAGADFASLLVQLGPTLKRLALKDSIGQAIGGILATQINPTLRASPHDGTLDFALQHCTSLQELALEWTLTGSKFLSAIERAPLFSVVLLGSPQHTAAADLISKLRSGFTSLRYVNLICFGTQTHQASVWTARDVRALRKACADRKLEFVFSASI